MEYRVGHVTVRIESIGGNRGAVDWAPPPSDWRRAVRLIERLGVEGSLNAMDQRAERALCNGRVAVAVRWRNLMVAVHMLSREERLHGERDN